MTRRRRPPPIISHTTTAGILKHAASLFYSHLFIFLYLSKNIYDYRSHANGAVHNLSSRIDRDPHLKSLIAHTDDEIFSGASVFDRFLSSTKPIPNATLVPLSHFNPYHGFAGISFPEIVNPESKTHTPIPKEEETEFGENSSDDDVETFLGLGFLIKRFEWRHRKANSLLTLAGVVSITYAYSIFELICDCHWIYGIIFLKVVDNLVGNNRPFYTTFWYGHNIAARRWPSRLILMKWAVRGALAHLIGVYFFWKVEDLHTFLKVLLRISFMPSFDLAPWVAGHEWESAGFAVIWFLIDIVTCLVFSIESWVLVVNAQRRGAREALREGCQLLGTLFCPAFVINVLEAVMCGCIGRLVLKMMFGEGWTTMYLQEVMGVYFKIAWLVFYFAARQKAGASVGRSYGRREFQQLANNIA